MKALAKGLLLIFLTFHLLVMVLMPNSQSLLTKKFSKIILPYANAIGLNVSWQFFSPDPANTMYIQYKVFFENELGEETKETVSGIYPEDHGLNTDIPSRRLVYSMRFFVMDTNRLKYVFAPYLCRIYEGATRVTVEHVIEPIPALERAAILDESDLLQTKESIRLPEITRSCKGEDEVAF